MNVLRQYSVSVKSFTWKHIVDSIMFFWNEKIQFRSNIGFAVETIERFGVVPHRAANTIQFMSEQTSLCPNQSADVRTSQLMSEPISLCPSQSAYLRTMLCVAQRMILLEFGMGRFCMIFALSRHVVHPRSFYLSGLPSV